MLAASICDKYCLTFRNRNTTILNSFFSSNIFLMTLNPSVNLVVIRILRGIFNQRCSLAIVVGVRTAITIVSFSFGKSQQKDCKCNQQNCDSSGRSLEKYVWSRIITYRTERPSMRKCYFADFRDTATVMK